MSTSGRRFAIGETDFLLDEKPWRVLSGSLHYFRIHPDQWADRIAKARGMGLNTIETYVAWNAHSPSPGEFRTEGGLDLGRFLDLVAEQGMYAIVRPGRTSARSGTTAGCRHGCSSSPAPESAAASRRTWRRSPSTTATSHRSWCPGRSTTAARSS